MAKFSQQELERHLWGAADILRCPTGRLKENQLSRDFLNVQWQMLAIAGGHLAAASAACFVPTDAWQGEPLTGLAVRTYIGIVPRQTIDLHIVAGHAVGD
jgi:hypothetical protein